MAASPSPTPEPFTFVVQFIYHKLIKPKPGSRAQVRDNKETKTKELETLVTEDDPGYITFLEQLLAKHGESKYPVTKQRAFPFKYSFPKVPSFDVRYCSKADAVDIDNSDDWKDFVRALKGHKVYIQVNMQNVIQLAKNPGQNLSDKSDGNEYMEDPSAPQLSPMDTELARIQCKLEKTWANPSGDRGYTYIPRNGGPVIPLTPAAMMEWVRAIHNLDSTVNITTPPNTQTFDLAKREAMLHPSQHAAAPQLSEVTQVLDSVKDLIGVAKAQAALQTPMQSHTTEQLYAEEKLGVEDAMQHEAALRQEKYGPDILGSVPDKDLAALCIPKGNIICLKAGSLKWFNSPDAKCKHSEVDPHVNTSRDGPSMVLKKKIRCQRRYSGDGLGMFWAAPPICTDEPSMTNRNLDYYSEELVPDGYIVNEGGDSDDDLQM
ncbi:hypothetical protein BOTBODRAFT_42054 [Botryobasidium botryosum FD-172 SS1]|uniref:Uncharacterized protein n=1 Tax=Botryobasidium botryosum (strain FD-172 SS1) TaxID=930990 RepID=A0A067MTW2_BOTB1|nr:hypothetical protein BOTBODRAFT_42054 [Botryobasidium botryosum FD-172 SS1]